MRGTVGRGAGLRRVRLGGFAEGGGGGEVRGDKSKMVAVSGIALPSVRLMMMDGWMNHRTPHNATPRPRSRRPR